MHRGREGKGSNKSRLLKARCNPYKDPLKISEQSPGRDREVRKRIGYLRPLRLTEREIGRGGKGEGEA